LRFIPRSLRRTGVRLDRRELRALILAFDRSRPFFAWSPPLQQKSRYRCYPVDLESERRYLAPQFGVVPNSPIRKVKNKWPRRRNRI
jgi:hypothetical protein